MKMKKAFILFLLLAMCFGTRAQILSSAASLESATYNANVTYQNLPHSQKILQYNSTQRIVLDKSTQNHSYFYLLNKMQPSIIKTVSMPQDFVVNDFSILGDTIYFCGQKVSNGVAEGFIAYTSVYDMFNLAQNYNYSLPVSVYDVYQLVTYYNNVGERVVAAIGGQNYGKIHYTPNPNAAVGPITPFIVKDNKNNTKSITTGFDNNGSWTID